MTTLQAYYSNAILIIIFLFSFVTNGQSQSTIYVNLNAAGANNGSSWNDAFLEVQDAINAANAGDAIWVAAGTYYPSVAFDADNSGTATTREQTFYINKDIQLYGQFNGTETMLSQRHKANATILSGDIGTLQDATDNAFHLVYLDGTTSNGIITANTILDGFILEYGVATGSNFPNNVGGGIFINGRGAGSECSPTLINLSLGHNTATGQGGAIYNDGSQGGTCSLGLSQLYFYSNTAQDGGAIYNNGDAGQIDVLISESQFKNNIATQGGGAIYNLATNSGQINDSTTTSIFQENSANQGAVYYNRGTSSCNLSMGIGKTIFKENESLTNGGVFYNESFGGVFNIRINNSTFNSNISNNFGGVFYNNNNLPSTGFISCLLNEFNDNVASNSGGICYSTVENATQEIVFKENLVSNTIVNGNGGVFFLNGDLYANIFMNVTKNEFNGNNATNGGVFYYIVKNTNLDVQLEENSFFGSLASNGGVSFLNATLNSIVSVVSFQNTYVFNTANDKGGVFLHSYSASIGNMALVNDIFHVNTSATEGVVYNKGAANSTLFSKIVNCTFNENSAVNGARSISNIATSSMSLMDISNSIFSHIGGTTPQVNNMGGQMKIAYSLYNDNNSDGTVVLPSGVTGNNNIDGAPLYNNEAGGDLTMQESSPTINAGSNDSLPSFFAEDNLGQNRVYDNFIDMGALEYNNSLFISVPFLQQISCNGQADGMIGIKILGTTQPLMVNGVLSMDPTHYSNQGLAAGTYQYTFLDSLGRTDNISVTIVEPLSITLSTTSLSTGVASVTASGGTAPYTYLWDDANAQSTDVARSLPNGTYTVIVTDVNGCTAIATVTINLTTSHKIIARHSASNITIAPNPSYGQVQINFNLEEEMNIQPVLYNLQGQIVHEFDYKEGQKINYTENLSELPAGTYFLKTRIKNEYFTQPLVLVK